jgi:hypothetical protein
MRRQAAALMLAYALVVSPARAYVLNRTIPDSRDSRNAGVSGCPHPDHMDTQTPGKLINRRWSTSVSSAVKTSTGTWTSGNSQQLTEIAQVITESFAAWAGVPGTTLTLSKLDSLQSTPTQNACSSYDGLNSICFNQSGSFDSGVLAFTLNVTSDILGEPYAGKTSAFIGEILDSDIYFRPSGFTFATPAALPTNTSAYDLESVLTHELGHTFGLSHSSVWRAMMWPYVSAKGSYTGLRPTPQALDAPLADDDRAGLRVLYPDPSDTTNAGSISGKVLPANPLSLAGLPEPSPGRKVTGIFGAQVVAVDAATGAVIAATLAGWSCDPSDLPTKFDGYFIIEKLPVGRSYIIFAEPLDDPTTNGNICGALLDLCRAGTNNSCTLALDQKGCPTVNTNFNTRVRPGS